MQILIADDHILLRAGLKRLIESLGDFDVVGEASSNKETLNQLEKKHPDVLLLDISMPDGSGLDIAPGIHKKWPDIKILVLSMHSDMEYVKNALTCGASGYMVKDAAPEELELALNTVKRGQVFLSPSISNVLVNAWNHPPTPSPADKLSPRQQEILELIGEGFSTREIAEKLGLSIKTIETHRARMVQTLGLKRGTELLRYALHHHEAA